MRISDETLDHLAERFVGEQIGATLKIDFSQYLANPALYDMMLAHYRNGGGINIQHGVPRSVRLH